MYFIRCIESRTPEVVKDLATDLLPHYRSQFWAEGLEYGSTHELYIDKMAVHHLAMAEALIAPEAPSERWHSYKAVRERLLAWADQYQIRATWILKHALDALLFWTWHPATAPTEGIPVTDLNQSYAESLTPEERDAYLVERRMISQALENGSVRWPVSPLGPWDLPPRGKEVFEYPQWDGQDEKHYERVIVRMFRKHLAEYLATIPSAAKAYVRVEPVTKPERFEMLALYLCRGITSEKLAEDPKFDKDPSGILRDIHEAASRVGLSLRPPGRPARPAR